MRSRRLCKSPQYVFAISQRNNTNLHNYSQNFQDNCAGQSQNPARPLDRAKRTGTLLMREKGRLARWKRNNEKMEPDVRWRARAPTSRYPRQDAYAGLRLECKRTYPLVRVFSRHAVSRHVFYRELRGSYGMGVVSNSWFDRVFVLNPLHVQTLTSTDVQTPSLGTPLVPLTRLAPGKRWRPPARKPQTAHAARRYRVWLCDDDNTNDDKANTHVDNNT